MGVGERMILALFLAGIAALVVALEVSAYRMRKEEEQHGKRQP